ncbi:MAG TPA: gamma-glutamyl-phosphate reductase, partial [Verrucomicrobiae bacterium]|nr:gamma-glutamyl-phosphate reductase [Verrucomicrobiae bacterium]
MLSELEEKGRLAKGAARILNSISTAQKNLALEKMAAAIVANKAEILAANAVDVENAKAKGHSASLINRLALEEKGLAEISQGLLDLIGLPDPVGEIVSGWTRPNGLQISQ